MRTYIEDHGAFVLLESIEGFHLTLHNEDSRISITRLGDVAGRHLDLVTGLDEVTAKSEMENLLRLTADGGVGTTVITWNGEQFTKRLL